MERKDALMPMLNDFLLASECGIHAACAAGSGPGVGSARLLIAECGAWQASFCGIC